MAEIIRVKLSQLTETEHNPRQITREDFQKLKTSLEEDPEFLEARPIVVDENLVILGGHQRVKALKALGTTETEVQQVKGWSEEKKRRFVIKDNLQSGEWDMDELANSWDDLPLEDWGIDLGETFEEEDEIVEDTPPEAPEEPKSKPGDLYILGEHRLLCGDSTDPEQLARLLDGNIADCLVTDPPYNVDYANFESAEGAKRLHHRTDGLKVANDSMDHQQFVDFLVKAYTAADSVLKPGGVFYIWHASSGTKGFLEALDQKGWKLREILIWVKDRLSLGRQDYQWRHEPCLYGWKDGAGHYFIDDRTKTTVIEDEIDIDSMSKQELKDHLKNLYEKTPSTVIHEDKPSRSELHPTMKPVKLIARLIENSTRPGEAVLDIFGGSGTTLIAAQQLGRKSYLMELDPHYVDVIVERWENFTGLKAEKIPANN